MTGKPLSHEAYIGLGSNLGDRKQFLFEAIANLHRLSGCEVAACSNIYETDPVGFLEQPAFLNMAIRIRTVLEPEALLDQMMGIEQRLGRVRDVRFGPRTLDLDLLLYGRKELSTPRLQLPHPRMAERLFVLIPLQECMDDQHKAWFTSLFQPLQNMEHEGGVKLWRKVRWQDGSALLES